MQVRVDANGAVVVQYFNYIGLIQHCRIGGTAKGIVFETLEDETGVTNLIVRPDVWERFYQTARTASAWIAQGRLERHGEVIHVLVSKLA